ncbi:hypothetical protein NK718_02850 [Alsobacter sp. SYSU M60028]|uniref:Uncharacterized protein n=1 Tax=Alsobacter ponti TaxID=2962936 RepID=A0ABT1L7H7_9HYPH|nr:hypothetical protein [Alsobacter ponti]MCP8937441.1 hypothetical protein [Alsobacter ponti]
MASDTRPGAPAGRTTEGLRAEIDSGRTGDKVAFSDPAAAPLGADDEAAGHPPGPEEVALAWRQERLPSDARGAPARPDQSGRGWSTSVMVATILATAVIVALGAAWMM